MPKYLEYDGVFYTCWDGRDYYSPNGTILSHGGTSLHRQVWIDNNGPIPEGYHIHHVDHNTDNNCIENLQMVNASDHARYHLVERHKSGELAKSRNVWIENGGRETLRENAEKMRENTPYLNLRALIVLAKLEQNTRLKNDAKNAQRKEMQKATSQKLALFAEKSSCTKHTQQNKSSLVVQSVDGFCENKLVYNLTVEQAGLYYANGMLSSNTEAEDHLYDAVRYRVLRGSNKWAIKIKTNWIR